MLAPLLRRLHRLTPSRAARLAGYAVTSILAASAVHWFLDPGFPTRAGSAAFALGMLLGIAVVVGNTLVTWRIYMRRRVPGVSGGWTVYPGQIAVAMVCVAVSRVAHFVPGLIMGLTGDFEPERRLELHHLGRRAAFTCTVLLVISLGAWLASIPLAAAAAEPGAGFATLTLDAALAVIAVGGMETLVFTLAPFAFLDGHDLFHWNRRIWLALWGTGAIWVSVVIVNPAISHYEGKARASVGWLASLLALQALIAVSLWAYFATRRRPPSVLAE